MAAKPISSVDRMKLLLSSGDGADVHFLVGQRDPKELLSAHKLILMAASDVFEAMFRFDSANATTSAAKPPSDLASSSNPVVVSDVNAGVFRAMLGFIYADDLSGMNGDNLFDVLYAAKKYNIAGLVKACAEFPISELGNVFHTLAEARLFGEKAFAEHCLEYIDQNADTLLKSEEFLRIDQKMLCDILKSDQLVISREFTLWKAQKGIECSGENRREMLGLALFEIRFPHITKEDFSKSIVPCGVLTDQEVISVLLHHCLPCHYDGFGEDAPPAELEQYPLRFEAEPRDYISKGTLSLKIESFSSEFAHKKGGAVRFSKSVRIREIFWRITMDRKIDDKMGKCVKFYLQCSTENPSRFSRFSSRGTILRCSCWTTRRIVSQKEGKKDHVRENPQLTFSASTNILELGDPMPIEKLMSADNGWYDEADDTVTVEVEVIVDEPYLRESRWRAVPVDDAIDAEGFGNGGFAQPVGLGGGWAA
ncbi:hypothetical protein niasHS_017121 [Heterodera schachtii]|uniref:BTB domain-containing protein n=1 Tax=Heterodera schachtii TaxID=97005 RepID=A0ABD2I0K0_HETSC